MSKRYETAEVSFTSLYGEGDRLVLKHKVITCDPADWPDVRAGLPNPQAWSAVVLGGQVVAVEAQRVAEDSAIDRARASWTPARKGAETRLRKRVGLA